MTCDAISKATYSRGSGSGARGARGAERRESDTRAGVRVRYARLGARRGCAVGGGAWAWVGGGGGRSGEAGCSVRLVSDSIANKLLTASPTPSFPIANKPLTASPTPSFLIANMPLHYRQHT